MESDRVFGLTVDEKTLRRLSLSWGVKPMMCEMYPSVEVLFFTAKRIAKEALGLKHGDKIIILDLRLFEKRRPKNFLATIV